MQNDTICGGLHMLMKYRRSSLLILMLATTGGCNALKKTAPIAPSGVLAACSARELATALWLKKGDEIKIKHGLTISSETAGEGGLEGGIEFIKASAGISGKLAKEKASELELELPEEKLCIELGYVPQLGRWTFKSSGIEAKFAQLDKKPCAMSNTNNCLCRPVTKRMKGNDFFCSENARKKQAEALLTRYESSIDNMERHREAQLIEAREEAADRKWLLDCRSKCDTCEVAAPQRADDTKPQDTAGKQASTYCVDRCTIELLNRLEQRKLQKLGTPISTVPGEDTLPVLAP